MSWLSKLSSKKTYIGNCIHGLNDERFMDIVNCYDATQLAQFVDNGVLIDYYSFTDVCDMPSCPVNMGNIDDYEFFTNGNIMWMHDLNQDVHYFFA